MSEPTEKLRGMRLVSNKRATEAVSPRGPCPPIRGQIAIQGVESLLLGGIFLGRALMSGSLLLLGDHGGRLDG